MRIQSNDIVILDTTDSKKIDLHISSNHPTVQIYDPNNSHNPITPDWSVDPLVLTPVVYIDGVKVEDKLIDSFTWTKIIGSGATETVSSPIVSKVLTVSDNKDLKDTATIRYRCTVGYNNGKSFSNEITFAHVDVGKDGYTPQKGIDYFDGKNGEPGKSVGIKGVAYTNETFSAGAQVTLFSDPEYKNQITTGYTGADTVDGYLVDGYLCVYTGEYFIWTGKIQGPQGQKGESTYLFTRYADDQNGGGFSDSPIGKKYIGFYRHSEKTLPSTVGTGYSDWSWVKYVGEDAKSISLSATTQVFRIGKDGKISPSTLTITPQAVNTSITEWLYGRNGGTFSTTLPAGVVRDSDGKITITGTSMTDNSISVRVGDGTYSDTLTIYKVYDGDKGIDAPIAFLTNESIGFAANANGQIAETTVYCNIVAYQGVTKITPTIGTITEIPNGMTITSSTIAESNEIKLTIKIANNSTLGSTSNISNKAINIPVSTPVETNLKLNWSKVNAGLKGETGVGIDSVTVDYGVSTSASTQPESWQLTIPTVADGSYLWTRTVTAYTDGTDTVTFTYAKQGVKGDAGSAGSSITVSKIEYQSGTSATIAPTSTWSNSVVSVAEGNYLWTKTTFSDNKVAYGVAKQGQKGDKGDKGDTGRGVSKITEYYLATADSSDITTSTSGWTTTIQSIDTTKKYLWNYELITYTDSTTSSTTPVIIGVFGNTGATGKGISSVTEHYLATASSSGVTTSTTGWTPEIQTLTATKKYLWNYEIITYTDGTISTTNPVIIGVYGDKGDQGIQGPKGNDAYTVILTNESHIFAGNISNAIAGTAETQILAYNGSAQQSITIVSVDGKTASTSDANTSIAGLKFKCSALSGTSPKITFTCTTDFVSPSGTIPIILSIGGVQFTKMFTYSIAFKGSVGTQGPAGSPATAYWLVSSASAVQKTSTGTITVTPSTLTFTGKSQTGTNAPADYACRWIIAYSTDGTTYTNLYTSTANEASKAITVATTYKTIRARMYLAGGTTTLLDEQIIPVVSDGTPGTSASIVDVTPSALYFKSTTGKDGTFTPEFIYLYPRFQNATYSNWQYSIDGGVNWVAASGANGLTVSTYSSIANTLRISRASTLYTDSITSISFRCNSATSGVYDTVSVAKIYDVVDLNIGGRNLLLNTSFDGENKKYNLPSSVTGGEGGLTFTLSEPLSAGTEVALRFQVRGLANVNVYWMMTGGNVSQTAILKNKINTTNFSTLEMRYTIPSGKTLNSVFICTAYGNSTPGTDWFEIKAKSLKLELGNTFTDWTPAPEDVDANIAKVNTTLTNSLVDVKTTANSAESRVSETEKSITTINNNITSIADKVSAAEQKITADAIVSTVTKSTTYTNDLGKKVNSTEIISKINQTAETITISASKIGILGATNIPDLTADKIKGGTLTLGGSSATTKNGQILVKNSSDADMVKMNKDGIFVESGKLSIAQDVDGHIAYDEATDQYYPTTNTSILELKDNEITMGIKGLTTNVRLNSSGLNLGGHIQGFGGYGSYIGNRTIGSAIPLVVQDDVQSDIRFLGASDVELARLTVNGFSIGGTDERSIVFANAGSNNGQVKIYKGSSSSSTVLGVWDDANNRAVMRYLTDGTLFLDRPVNFGMGIQNKSKVLWSGMISSGNITLADAYTNYSFLTCIIGTTTITEGTTLGAFYDIDQNELHFGSIFTGHNGLAGENLYGAIFTVPNMSNRSVINLARCGTKTTSGYYVKKIVGWI